MLTRLSIRHAHLVLVGSWILAVLCALITARLQVLGDFSRLLPPNATAVRHLRELERRTRVLADYMIGVESNDPGQRAAAAADLRTRLGVIDPSLIAGITTDDSVSRRYIWNNRYLFAPLADLVEIRDALEAESDRLNPWSLRLDADGTSGASPPVKVREFENRLSNMKTESEAPGIIVSADGHLQLLIVRTTFTADDSIRGQKLTALLERANRHVEQDHPGVRVGMTGDVINTGAEHRALLRGMLTSTLFTIVLVVGGLLLFYRSLTAVGALGWSLCVGVLATFAFTQITIGHLNLASAFLSSIVIGNGINFGLVYLARYFEELRLGLTNSDALVQAADGSARGTVPAAVAAAVAYGSLAVTQFRGFRDFGIIGASGMLLCWVTAYTVLPAGLFLLRSRITAVDAGWFTNVLARNTPRLGASVMPIAFAAFGVTGLLGIVYLSQEPFEDDLRNLRSVTSDLGNASRWMRKFDRAFGTGISGGFAIGVDERIQAPAVVQKLKAVDEGKPVRAHIFSQIHSLDEVLPMDQNPKLAVLADLRKLLDSPEFKRLPMDEQQRLKPLRPPDFLRALTDTDVPQEVAWPYTERDGTRGRLILANTGLGVDTWRLHSLEHFANTLRALQLGPHVVVGGSAFVFSDMISMMRIDGPRATCISLAGSAGVVLLLLGARRYGLATLASAALGVLGMLSIVCLLGIKVNFLDFVALPITVGIGVDYAVNIAARAKQLARPNGGHCAVITTGPVIILCSFTTIVGYASLLFSLNRGIHTFGLCAMIGELTCLTTAIIFTPALLDWQKSARHNTVGTDDVVADNASS